MALVIRRKKKVVSNKDHGFEKKRSKVVTGNAGRCIIIFTIESFFSDVIDLTCLLGRQVGCRDGCFDGCDVGCELGTPDGGKDGTLVGISQGCTLGTDDG